MESFQQFMSEAKGVDGIVDTLKDAGVKPEVMSDGKNYNVAFKVGDDEYYVRPNDKGDALFYVDSDISDDYDAPKIKDLKELGRYVKGLTKPKD